MKQINRKIMLVIVMLLTCISISADANRAIDVYKIDPALHGVWVLVSSSSDCGKTIKKQRSYGIKLCKVWGDEVILTDGTRMKVRKVLFTKENGVIFNVVYFYTHRVMWIISKPRPPYIHLQIIDMVEKRETVRMKCQLVGK